MFAKMKFIMSQAWDFLAPFIWVMMTQAGQLLAKTALEAVSAVNVSMQSADGPAKRAQAFETIKDELLHNCVSLATSTINAAIEAAVIKLKGA